MKKNLIILLVSILCFGNFSLKADEGMWLPLFVKRLNYADMQQRGLKLTAEEIYSLNKSSLKIAAVKINHFIPIIIYIYIFKIAADT